MRSSILFILVLLGYHASSQYVLTGAVSDKTNGAPLIGAHVYIINTSIGATTGTDGTFSFDTKGRQQLDLIISYVGYQTINRNIEVRKSTAVSFELKPSSVQLSELTIDIGEDKQWKRNLKRFTRALIGESSNGKQCELLNPWVIDFEKENGILKAHANEILIIRNYALGYDIHFLLEAFALGGPQTYYGGKSVFIPLDTLDYDVKEQWDIARKKSYAGSKSHFFKALIAEKLSEEGFTVYQLKKTNGELKTVGKLNEKDLIVVDEAGRRAVSFKFIKVMFSPLGNVAADRHNSSLLLRTSKVYVSEEGLLASDLHIDEFGYWSELRVGDLLPEDYIPIDPD